VHSVGDVHSTSRITHSFFDNEEVEKIESLDGPIREFLRKGNNLQCMIPESRTVRSDRRIAGRHFPQMVQTTVEQIASNYAVMLGAADRVAGYDCRWLHLNPRDNLRYSQRLCSENGSGLFIKAKLIGPNEQIMEQFTFTELRVGPRVGRTALRSRWEDQRNNWKQEPAIPADAVLAKTGWAVSSPNGFTKVAEMRRMLPNRPTSVDHLILSDGIASLSIFIEPINDGKKVDEVITGNGCASVYIGSTNNHMVTVLGEVPPQTAKIVGKGISVNAKPARYRGP
jgi:sigma-E factor negative regulatory protein RseB